MNAVWGGEVAEGEDLKISDFVVYFWTAICTSAVVLMILNLRGK